MVFSWIHPQHVNYKLLPNVDEEHNISTQYHLLSSKTNSDIDHLSTMDFPRDNNQARQHVMFSGFNFAKYLFRASLYCLLLLLVPFIIAMIGLAIYFLITDHNTIREM